MAVVPCSHVSHLSRWDADEDPNTGLSLMNEALRVATIWLPNYLHIVRMAWDLPRNHEVDVGDVSIRVAMRDRSKCKNFAWFIKDVFPMFNTITDITSYGVLKNGEKEDLCLDQENTSTKKLIMNMCNSLSTQRVYLAVTGQIIVGGLDFEMVSPMRTCLTENRTLKQVVLIPCSSEQSKDLNSFWSFEQGGAIKSRATENCLELARDNNALYKMSLVLATCTAQTWEIVPNNVQE
uniref:probable polypeptide N-acetylgalactosaminyltransferase 8 n=1 Tax=Myxine glutinosa TaxID=7769 RepID=UPI00358FB587